MRGVVWLGHIGGFSNIRQKQERVFVKEFGIEAIPSKATFARVLSCVSGKEIGDAVLDILRMRFGIAGEVIAVDGKAIRSTAKPGNPHSALQILSAYVTGSGVVLAQEAIHEKTNEIPVFQEMLSYLDIEGKTVTADAMHCQRKTCRRVIQRKGDYLFGLKENSCLYWKTFVCFLKVPVQRSWTHSKPRRKTQDVSKREAAVKSWIFLG